ncbi:MAG: 3-phenylpropionate/cinnamic acid dioxygenase subunit beta, partial [Stellaceae bacterium]
MALSEDRLAYLDLMREIEDFLHAEADLLDERQYTAWLDLFTEDVRYWMPIRKNVAFADRAKETTAEDDIAWIDDDKLTLGKRVQQLLTGIHWSEEPVSRVSHVVSNIRLAEPASRIAEGANVLVTCRFLVYRNRLETDTDLLVGRREDTLRRVGGGFK